MAAARDVPAMEERREYRRNGPVLLTLLALALLGLFWVSGVWRGSGEEDLPGGVIRIGYAVEPPYAFVASGGAVTGESAETARLIATSLGLHIEWVQTSFDALIPELLDGRFDVIAAGMFITRERSRRVLFSEPTLRVRPGLLAPKGNPQSLATYADLRSHRELRVAVLAGSVEERRLAGIGMPSARLIRVPDAHSGCAAVAKREADVLALSLPSVRAMNCNGSGVEATPLEAIPLEGGMTEQGVYVAADDYVAFAFSLGRPGLVSAWNRAQAGVVAGDARLALIAPFGFTPEDLPRGVSLASIIGP